MIRPTLAGIALAALPFALPLQDSSTRTIRGSLVTATQAPDSVKVILAEVLFDPAAGDTAFVELLNVGTGPAELTSFVLRIDSTDFPLPRLPSPFAAGSRVLIRFDRRAMTEDRVVHAPSRFGLKAEGGTVSVLLNDDRVLDRVAWGTADGAIVPTMGGLAIPQIERGTSLGRPPGANRAGARSDWVFYPPGQASPGQPNPLPSVAQLLPADGAILEGSSAELSWYPVPGAASYRVQLSRDTSFSAPLLNQTVASPTVSTGELSAGVYWWRVQAMPADGPAAAWSRPARIELGSPSGGGGASGGAESDAGGGGPSEAGSFGEAGVAFAPSVLNVPYLTQHKDSKMLHLEAHQEGRQRTSAMLPRVPHTWDGDHGILDKNDPVDNMNCTLASLAMINRYYGGDLTQDRIGYEVWSRNVTKYRSTIQAGAQALLARLFVNVQDLRELQPGPEGDLHIGQGMPWARLAAAGLFTLGELPSDDSGWLPPYGTLTRDAMWGTIMREIDAGRPILGSLPGHAVVIRGYELRGGRRLVFLNDPWSGRYALDLDAAAPPPTGRSLRGIWVFPNHPAIGRLEPSVTTDSDRDEVVDFDEVERFRTNPGNKDSDADGVEDKNDIRSGIFELEWGVGYAWNPGPNSQGRDFDFDGIPTELDPDSDGGGCKDGEEDLNGDGVRAGSETGNFYQGDDMCGTLVGNVSYLFDAINTDPKHIIREAHDQGVILVKLKPESPGSAGYVDDGSTFTYQGHARIEIVFGPNCILWGREVSRASGPFTGVGAEIGGTRGDDGSLSLGAQASVPAQSSTGGCGGQGGTSPDERTLSFPHCNGKLMPSAPGARTWKTYRFDCTTKPNLGPGWTVTKFYARGFIRVR